MLLVSVLESIYILVTVPTNIKLLFSESTFILNKIEHYVFCFFVDK